jgi:hypothetical protein
LKTPFSEPIWLDCNSDVLISERFDQEVCDDGEDSIGSTEANGQAQTVKEYGREKSENASGGGRVSKDLEIAE